MGPTAAGELGAVAAVVDGLEPNQAESSDVRQEIGSGQIRERPRWLTNSGPDKIRVQSTGEPMGTDKVIAAATGELSAGGMVINGPKMNLAGGALISGPLRPGVFSYARPASFPLRGHDSLNAADAGGC